MGKRIWCDLLAAAVNDVEGSKDVGKFTKRLKTAYPELSEQAINEIYARAVEAHGNSFRAVGSLQQQIGSAVAQAAYDQKPALKKATTLLNGVLNFPRSATTWGDIPVMRQGGILSASHPVMAGKNIAKTIRAMWDEGVAQAVDAQVKARSTSGLRDDAGVYMQPLDRHAPLEAREEAYMNTLAERIPGVGRAIRGSERAFATYLNLMRADAFDYSLGKYREAYGKDPNAAELKALGTYVNVATGRGSLGQLEAAAPLLNTIFFSPRYAASRFQYLTAKPLWEGGGSKEMRGLIAKEYARYALGVASMVGLAKMAQMAHPDGKDKIDVFGGGDPRSADFGKVRVGNTHFDMMSGLNQQIVLLSRLLTQKTYQRGKLVNLGERPKGSPTKAPTGGDLVAKFGRQKLAPVPGLAASVISNERVPASRAAQPVFGVIPQGPQVGTDVVGDPVTPLSALSGMTMPMGARDVYEAAKNDGAGTALAAAIASFFSMSTASYPSVPKKK